MAERDDLDELRRAWKSVEPPAPDRPLDEPDEATRAAVEWMRAAWEAVEPPVPIRIGPPSRPASWRRWLPSAAAAALLLASALWVLLGLEVDRGVSLVGYGDPETRPMGSATSGAFFDESVRVAAIDEDHTELRSGPVRLILLNETNVHAGPDGLGNDEVIR